LLEEELDEEDELDDEVEDDELDVELLELLEVEALFEYPMCVKPKSSAEPKFAKPLTPSEPLLTCAVALVFTGAGTLPFGGVAVGAV
jgi:hypothetical protein